MAKLKVTGLKLRLCSAKSGVCDSNVQGPPSSKATYSKQKNNNKLAQLLLFGIHGMLNSIF